MSERGAALAAALLVLAGTSALAAEASVLPLPFRVEAFRGPGSYLAGIAASADPSLRQPGREGPLALAWGEGKAAALVLEAGEVSAVALRGNPANLGERPNDAVPGSRQQAAGPLKTYLANPRPGRETAAGTLVVEERRPVAASGGVQRVPVTVTRLEAGPDAAYEAVEPRLADLDGDGMPEIVTVRTTPTAGPALVVAARGEGTWRLAAEGAPAGDAAARLDIGPVAVLDRTRRPAVVVTRAASGQVRLQVWAYEGGALRLVHDRPGLPTGVAADDVAAADLDGDGSAEIVAPTADRTALAVLTVRGTVEERARIPLPGPAGSGLAVLGAGKAARIVAVLADGRVAVVRP